MTEQVQSTEGDTLDAVCNRHYGRTDVLPTVLNANPGITEQGIFLAEGTIINLPVIEQPQSREIRLWD